MTRTYPKHSSFFATWFAACALLAALPACNFGSFSFGSKPATSVGSPTQQSGSAKVPVKFQIRVQSPTTNQAELTAVVPFDLGLCSPAMTVEAVTATGERAAVRVRTIVRLTGVSPYKLFSDSRCLTQLTADGSGATVEIDKGTGSAEIYMKTNMLADINPAYSLVASSAGYTSGSRTLRVDQTIQSLTFAVAPSTAIANSSEAGGAVCETFYVNGVDGINNVFFTGSVDATVKVSSGLIYLGSDTNCTGSGVTQLAMSLTSNSETRKFRYRSGSLSSASTIGQSSNFSVTSRFPAVNLNVNVVRKPVKFEFLSNNPTENVLGLCSAFTMRMLDAANNAIAAPAGATYTYTVSPSTISGNQVGTLHSDANCNSAQIGSVAFTSASSQAAFYFKANGYPSDGQTVRFTATPYATTPALQFFSSLDSANVTFKSELRGIVLNNDYGSPRLNICNGPYTLSVNDGRPGGNAKPYIKAGSVTLATSSSRKYYSDNLCSSEISGGVVNLPVNVSTARYYFVDTGSTAEGNSTNLTISVTSALVPSPVTLVIAVRNVLDIDTSFGTGTYQGAVPYPGVPSMVVPNPRITATTLQGTRLVGVGHSYSATNGSNKVMLVRFATSGIDTTFGVQSGRSNGAKVCDLTLPSGGNSYSFITQAYASTVVSNGSYLYVGGYADVTDRVITQVQTGTDENGNPIFENQVTDTISRQYFVMRILADAGHNSCPSVGNNASLFVGKFAGGNRGNIATSIMVDGNNVVVGGYSGDLGAMNYDMAYAVHPMSDLSNRGSVVITPFTSGGNHINTIARFGVVQGSNYYFYGNASTFGVSASNVAVLKVDKSSGTPESRVITSQPGDYLAATLAPSGRVYVVGKDPSSRAVVVLRYNGATQENRFVDSASLTDGVTAGITVYEKDATNLNPDSEKVLVGTTVSSSGRAYRIARYSAAGAPDVFPVGSNKYRQLYDPTNGNDDLTGMHLLSDGRIWVTGNIGLENLSNSGFSTQLYLR